MRIDYWTYDVCASERRRDPAAAQRRHVPGDGVAVADDQHRAGGVGAAQAFGDGVGGRLGVLGNDAPVVDGGGGFGRVACPAEIGGIVGYHVAHTQQLGSGVVSGTAGLPMLRIPSDVLQIFQYVTAELGRNRHVKTNRGEVVE